MLRERLVPCAIVMCVSIAVMSLTSVRRKTEGTPARASLAQCFAAMLRRY